MEVGGKQMKVSSQGGEKVSGKVGVQFEELEIEGGRPPLRDAVEATRASLESNWKTYCMDTVTSV